MITQVKVQKGIVCRAHSAELYTLKMLACFNPTLGQIWTNPAIGFNLCYPKFAHYYTLKNAGLF